MGEISAAYKSLNKTLKLGLNSQQILAAEMQFKLDFAQRFKFGKNLTRSPNKLMEDWEFSAVLTPRRRRIKNVTKLTLKRLIKDAQIVRPGKIAAPKRVRKVARKVTKRTPKKG